jgi:hypothetical protein
MIDRVRPCYFKNNVATSCMYTADSKQDECPDKPCQERFVQLMVILGCLGCLMSYYAFTIGFLGSGPVTWIYKALHRSHGTTV